MRNFLQKTVALLLPMVVGISIYSLTLDPPKNAVAKNPTKPVAVTVMETHRSLFSPSFIVVGEYAPSTKAVISSPVSATVKAVNVGIDEYIEKDDILLEFDDSELNISLKEAEENLRIENANLQSLLKSQKQKLKTKKIEKELHRLAKNKLKGYKELVGQNQVSKSQYNSIL
jgi:multidrug efflux pump subunit AcrA (membrane-fusion protein)